jgi:hypothetical protein
MRAPSFVHLHLHTDFSLLDGACGEETRAQACGQIEEETQAPPLTNHAEDASRRSPIKFGISPCLILFSHCARAPFPRGECESQELLPNSFVRLVK